MNRIRNIKVVDLIGIFYLIFTMASVTFLVIAIVKSLTCFDYSAAKCCIFAILGIVAMLMCNLLMMFLPAHVLFRKVKKRHR